MSKVRDQHWEVMITFMEAYPSLATGRLDVPNAREIHKKLWQELAEQLNAIGYGEKSSDKWQKVNKIIKIFSKIHVAN